MSDLDTKKRTAYPWKGFFIFIGVFILSLALHYPALFTQTERYLAMFEEGSQYTSSQFALLTLVQPALLGIVAIYFGHRYAHQVNLRSLVNEAVESNDLTAPTKKYTYKDSIPFILIIAASIALFELGFDAVFQRWLPDMFQPNFVVPSLPQALSSLFYSGFIQELLLRWGVMTAIIYVLSAKGKNLNQWHVFIGVVFTAILYAFAQYNAVLGYVDLSFVLLLRILLLSALPGIAYGWLYSAFHFEAAVSSHMLANLFILLGHIFIVEMSA